jgi:glycine cleavage system H protein
MKIVPENIRYASSHEWAHVEKENGQDIAIVGISAFAVEMLTDLVFMALPKVGKQLRAGEEFGEVESVKAVSPLYSPVSGEVIQTNDGLVNRLESLAQDPYVNGWIIKIKMSDPSEYNKLMDFAQYSKQCSESH